MTSYIALLRAVNVGGTGKLPMAELRRISEELGFENGRTYIASGNLLFASDLGEQAVRKTLEAALAKHMGKPVSVMIRTAAQMAQVAADSPFKDAPGQRVLAIFLNDPPPGDALGRAKGHEGERIALGVREIYVDYCGRLLGRSKLSIPAAATGTARNMNTVQKLAEMAGDPQ